MQHALPAAMRHAMPDAMPDAMRRAMRPAMHVTNVLTNEHLLLPLREIVTLSNARESEKFSNGKNKRN